MVLTDRLLDKSDLGETDHSVLSISKELGFDLYAHCRGLADSEKRDDKKRCETSHKVV